LLDVGAKNKGGPPVNGLLLIQAPDHFQKLQKKNKGSAAGRRKR